MRDDKHLISDAEIEKMIKVPKYVSNKVNLSKLKLDMSEDGRQFEKNIKLDCEEYNCQMRIRQSVDRYTNFSVILVCKDCSGNDRVILRLNGNHGRHKNRIEKNIVDGPHIHKMTERYQIKTTHPDGYAEATDEYTTLDEAIDKFVDMVNINYLETRKIRKLDDYND